MSHHLGCVAGTRNNTVMSRVPNSCHAGKEGTCLLREPPSLMLHAVLVKGSNHLLTGSGEAAPLFKTLWGSGLTGWTMSARGCTCPLAGRPTWHSCFCHLGLALSRWGPPRCFWVLKTKHPRGRRGYCALAHALLGCAGGAVLGLGLGWGSRAGLPMYLLMIAYSQTQIRNQHIQFLILFIMSLYFFLKICLLPST